MGYWDAYGLDVASFISFNNLYAAIVVFPILLLVSFCIYFVLKNVKKMDDVLGRQTFVALSMDVITLSPVFGFAGGYLKAKITGEPQGQIVYLDNNGASHEYLLLDKFGDHIIYKDNKGNFVIASANDDPYSRITFFRK